MYVTIISSKKFTSKLVFSMYGSDKWQRTFKTSDNYLDSDLFHSFVHGISVLFAVYQYFEPWHLGLALSLGTRPADVSDQLTSVVF